MVEQSYKVKSWKTKDYVKTILAFVLGTVTIIGFYVLTILLNSMTAVQGTEQTVGEVFKTYFKEIKTRQDFMYLVVETIIIIAVAYMYYLYEDRDFLKQTSNVSLVFTVIVLSLGVSFIMGKYVNVYARPFAFCAVTTLMLTNRRNAIFVNTVECLLLFIMDTFTNITFDTNQVYSSLILGFTSGILGIYLINEVISRVRVFLLGLEISLPTIVCVVILEIIPNSDAEWLWLLFYSVVSGILSTTIMMVLLPILEYVFNVVTDYRLSELTDSNSKLIKKLRLNAPGTYQHCIVVSTLAQACAIAIGEKTINARAAAYYHDMGKLKNPEYFSENQTGENPHNELTPELSADIIRSHASDGAQLIERYNLPKFLSDIAIQHHGTMPIKYFYAKAKKYTDSDVDIRPYSYVGPKPQSKLATIIMICDASEAKIRSMTDRSQEKIDKAVREIIEERMELDQFTECDITLQEIELIRKAIVENIAGIYHDRVKYPKIRIRKEDAEPLAPTDDENA